MLHVTKLTQNLNFFYQNIVRDGFDLHEHNLARIKTKLRSVCEKYHNPKFPYKHRDKQLILEQRNHYIKARQR